jgi:hypothetical protein
VADKPNERTGPRFLVLTAASGAEGRFGSAIMQYYELVHYGDHLQIQESNSFSLLGDFG